MSNDWYSITPGDECAITVKKSGVYTVEIFSTIFPIGSVQIDWLVNKNGTTERIISHTTMNSQDYHMNTSYAIPLNAGDKLDVLIRAWGSAANNGWDIFRLVKIK